MGEEKNTSKINFLLGLFAGMAGVSVIGFIVMLFIVFGSTGGADLALQAGAQNNPANVNQPVAEDTNVVPDYDPVKPITDTDYVKGNKNAKVVLIEYTDMECPYCLRHHATIKQIVEKYGSRIAYVQRHFPLTSINANAQKAAEAVECAGEQGKYYEMVEKVFEANQNKNMGIDTWKKAATALGLNASKFADCLDNGKFASKISQSAAEGAAAGVEGTPATFVNGQLVSGALSFETFTGIIDELLK